MNSENDTPTPTPATPAPGTPAPEIPAPDPATPATPIPENPTPAPAPATSAPVATKKRRKKDPKAAKEKEKLPPPTRMNDAGRGALKALKAANPELSYTQIVSDALIAMATKSAYQQPIQPKRIGKESLLILAGIVADAEAVLKDTFRKIIRARIDPEKKANLADKAEAYLIQFRELRQTICREAGIPFSVTLAGDARLAILALNQKKEETSDKYLQESYGNIIQLLERYQLDTFVPPEPPEPPEQSLTTDFNP